MSKHTERIGVVVVGGGAAGLVAAIMAARNGAKVLILEHNEVPGKKILATETVNVIIQIKCRVWTNITDRTLLLLHLYLSSLDWKRHCSSLKNLAYIQRSVTADIILRASRQLQSGMCC